MLAQIAASGTPKIWHLMMNFVYRIFRVPETHNRHGQAQSPGEKTRLEEMGNIHERLRNWGSDLNYRDVSVPE